VVVRRLRLYRARTERQRDCTERDRKTSPNRTIDATHFDESSAHPVSTGEARAMQFHS
jgi:hypothetical protein